MFDSFRFQEVLISNVTFIFCSTILETQADLTTSESNINSLAYTELRAAKDTGLLEELVKATANQTLLAYPSMTSEHRALYQ